MTAPSQTSEAAGLEDAGHIVWWKAGGVNYYPKGENFTVSTSCRVEPLVTAASAQAAIDAVQAENDVLKVEVLGLRAAIFGSHDFDPSLRHGNFIEMARATEDGRQGALARATAAEAELAKVRKALNRTCDPHWTLFYVKEALQQETQP